MRQRRSSKGIYSYHYLKRYTKEEPEMKRINVLIIGIFLVAFSGFFPGCVTDTATLKIEKSLPQSKLAYYNDSFDNFRTDLWEKAGYIHFEKQLNNFNLANL